MKMIIKHILEAERHFYKERLSRGNQEIIITKNLNFMF